MFRSLSWALCIVLACAAPAAAKPWAQKMFSVTSHDFGHLARGSKAEFAFELENPYEEDVHILDVRSSCGCTVPTVTKPTLKTWEKGAIVATLNTKAFLGQRTSTITVVFDKPYYAEVQLNIGGYIHTDVDFQPSSVMFGDVAAGEGAAQSIAINYHGRAAWQIMDVRSANENLEVELSDPMRTAMALTYTMTVKLKPEAPAGPVNDTLILVTNDPRLPSVSVAVEGRVVPPLSISPASLFLGTLEPGQKVTKQLVITGKQPFRITKIACDNSAVEFKTMDAEKKVHLVPVIYTAGEKPGEFEEKIEIETDLPAGGAATCVVRGTIKAAEAPAGSAGGSTAQ